MIQSLPCPACHRTLVLVAEASLQAVLRCRHCSHQFVLGEMVEAELGYWEVVDDPRVPEPKLASAVDDAVEDSDLQLAESEEYISPQALLNQNQPTKKNTDWSKLESITNEQYERMRRKAKSPIWSMLSVFLGGLASIPIATLLIWHVLGRDPLRLGPVVGRYVPWIVPERFQSNKKFSSDDNRPPAPRPGESGFRKFDGVLNDSPSDTRNTADASTPADDLKTTPDQLFSAEVPPKVPSNETPVTKLSSDDVFSLINQVVGDLNTWNARGDDREANKRLAYETYSHLSALALKIDELPRESPQKRLVRTELQIVGRTVSQHADMQQMIQICSRANLTSRPGDRVGLAIVAKVSEASEAEHNWHIKPVQVPNQEVLHIVVPKEVIPSISTSQNLFVVGCLQQTPPVDTSESPASSLISESVLTANFVHVLEP